MSIRLLAVTLLLASACARDARPQLVLATTTSVGNAGLLEQLLPAYQREHAVTFGVHLAGSGRALAMLAAHDADVVISHAPDAERSALRDHPGWWYRKVMFNDFLLVGPPGDPAAVRAAASLDDALRHIAASAAGMVSRADGSGTDERERALWSAAGVEPAHRIQTGQGMANTLRVAAERGAYTLTDRATWRRFSSQLALVAVSEGDPRLLNTYAVVVGPGDRSDDARAFGQWLAEGGGREIIAASPGFSPWPAGRPASSPDDRPK